MSDGFAALDKYIERLKRLGQLGADAARAAAPRILAAAKRTAAAGTTPDGEPWAPKKDGGRALVHAAGHLSVSVSGSTVRLELTGPDVIHNFGDKRNPKRQILPSKGTVPKNLADACREGAGEAFRETMGGR